VESLRRERHHLMGNSAVGTGDTAPFPTFLRLSIRLSQLVRFAGENGLSVEYVRAVEWDVQKKIEEENARGWTTMVRRQIRHS
jgi:hypothetical protein